MDTIIITTDFSETAQHATRYGFALAGKTGIKKVILYNSYYAANMATEVPLPPDEVLHHNSAEALRNQAAPYTGRFSIVCIANNQPVEQGVEHLVAGHTADLVIAGATGKSGISRLFMGSTTIALAQSGKFPLLVVPAGAVFENAGTVVFACNLLQHIKDEHAGRIRKLVAMLKSRLLVVNVEKTGKRFDPETIPGQYRVHYLLDDLQPAYHYIEAEHSTAAGIIGFAEEHQAGLIITIPETHGLLEGLFHASISKKLTEKSRIPLLILK